MNELFDNILKVTGGFIAGGAVRCADMKQNIRDVDVYFRSESEFKNALCAVGYTNDRDIERLLEKEKNAVSITLNGYSVDLCYRMFGTPEKVLSTFDFDCCCAWYDGAFHYGSGYHSSIACKKLFISNEIAYPWGALLRLQKYIGYGFYVPSETLYKIAVRLNQVDDFEKMYYEDKL